AGRPMVTEIANADVVVTRRAIRARATAAADFAAIWKAISRPITDMGKVGPIAGAATGREICTVPVATGTMTAGRMAATKNAASGIGRVMKSPPGSGTTTPSAAAISMRVIRAAGRRAIAAR